MSLPAVTLKGNNSAYDVSANQWNAIVAGVKNQPYTYLIYESGGTYYAKNGTTGQNDFSNSSIVDLTTAVNAATSAYGIIAYIGNFLDVPTDILLESYITYDLRGAFFKQKASAGAYSVFLANNKTGITILGGVIDGNKANNDGLNNPYRDMRQNGITFYQTTNSKIIGTTVQNTVYHGINLYHYSSNNVVSDWWTLGCGETGDYYNDSAGVLIFEGSEGNIITNGHSVGDLAKGIYSSADTTAAYISEGNQIINNVIQDGVSPIAGIYSYGPNHGEIIANNTISNYGAIDGTAGILVYSSGAGQENVGTKVIGNTILTCYNGVNLGGHTQNTIIRNNYLKDLTIGFNVYFSTDVDAQIYDNTLDTVTYAMTNSGTGTLGGRNKGCIRLANDGIDRARGKTATYQSWSNNPTPTANITDGDYTTAAQGDTTTVGAGTVGTVSIDLGSVYTVQLRVKAGISSDSGSVTGYWYYSDDGATYNNLSGLSILNRTSATEKIIYCSAAFANIRYLQFALTASGAQTSTIKLYAIEAMDFDSDVLPSGTIL